MADAGDLIVEAFKAPLKAVGGALSSLLGPDNVGKKSAIVAANGARDGGRYIGGGLAMAGKYFGD